jgi:CubicO group peptidase (beta-lactamase class C family)
MMTTHRTSLRLLSALSLTLLSACAWLAPTPALDPTVFPQIDRTIEKAIAEGRTPGAAFWLERHGTIYTHSYGSLSPESGSPRVDDGTLYDAASLTKVVVTATAVQLLIEDGKLGYEDRLVKHIPECAGGGRDALTLRHLLTHTSALNAGIPAMPAWRGKAEALKRACALEPTHPRGTFFRYSDANYILLGFVVERAAGKPLDVFAQERIFAPLGMRHSGYHPLMRFPAAAIAPTQRTALATDDSLHFDLPRNHELRGIVHDPTARFMGGVAGHAGLFTTVGDLAAFSRMLVDGGMVNGRRFLSPASIARLTTVQSDEAAHYRRSAGWDIESPFSRPRGALFPVGSFGHTGYTGCALWIDPYSKTFFVFLSNRVYPDDKNIIVPLYAELGTLAAKSVAGFEFANVPGALVARPPLPPTPAN